MKLEKVTSLKRAEKVVKLIKEKGKKLKLTTAWVESYQNGREQGLSICSIKYWIAIAEYRRSDEIVVYVDEIHPNRGITDEAYQKAKLFVNEEKAAEFILRVMIHEKTTGRLPNNV